MAKEKEGFKLFSFYIKKETLDRIRNQANKEERTLSNVVNRCIENGLISVEKDKHA